MRRSVTTAVVLALAVNAGVLLTLPLLGGALEAAFPQRPTYELRDVELVKLAQTPPAPVSSELLVDEEPLLKEEREPPAPGPDVPETNPGTDTVEAPHDLPRDIEIDIGAQTLMPEVALGLPEVTSGPRGGAAATGAKVLEKSVWSPEEVDRLPVKIYHVQPVYPVARLERGVEAVVVLSLTIGADGAVRDVRLHQSSGYRDFDSAALEALRQWRFAPALVGARAVTVRAVQRIRFSLR